tara:strand:+ start:1098 stop:1574 length:477 start_codon:yes stop_codon:yes gene_type:complete
MNIAVYPGSFDPITNGHLEIIHRSLSVFDKVIVAVLDNKDKDALFSMEYRTELISGAVNHSSKLEVDSFSGLLVDYLTKANANIIIRGLRVVSDFEFEFNMAQMNRSLDKSIDTIFMVPDSKNTFISSSLVREVASLGGDVSNFVPFNVNKALMERYE